MFGQGAYQGSSSSARSVEPVCLRGGLGVHACRPRFGSAALVVVKVMAAVILAHAPCDARRLGKRAMLAAARKQAAS